ncbi:MAG: hypothetical protein IKT46_00865 [Clostridia bacterium]|nr:hypothetical protein [Clostridia bacterium]
MKYYDIIKNIKDSATVIFDTGLSDVEISRIEEIYAIKLPESLKGLYKIALPVGEKNERIPYPNWRDFSPENIEKIKGMMYPYEVPSEHSSIEYPPLIPIWGHRYLPICELADPPVISCVEFDIIWYAKNLSEALQMDFLCDPFSVSAKIPHPKQVPYITLWSEAVEYNLRGFM